MVRDRPEVIAPAAQLNSARLSPTPLVYKTGRESFRFIRLLNSLVVVIYTSSTIVGRFYIMAMTMEKLEIVEFIFTAF